jgi:hypothetical protein
MKLHHIPSLALVGWYLLIPSPEMVAARRTEPPLSRWYHVGAYDTKDACSSMIATKLAEQHIESERWRYGKAICIDYEDPRFNGK